VNWLDSPVASANYVIINAVAPPTFSPSPGTYSSAQTVSLSSATSGAEIHYTIDGSTPTATSSLYSTPLLIAVTTTIKAIAIKTGMQDSTISSGTYTIGQGFFSPSISIDLAQGAPSSFKYGDDIPYVVSLSNFPVNAASATVTVNSSAVVVPSNTAGTTPMAVMKIGNTPGLTSGTMTIPLSNGSSTAPTTIKLKAFNGAGQMNATLSVTASAGAANASAQRTIGVAPQPGFISTSTYQFTNASDFVDTSTNKGWTLTYSNTGNTKVARFRNRVGDSNANLTVAKFSTGYSAVSAKRIVNGTLPEASIAVGTEGIEVTTTAPNNIYGMGTNSFTPVTVNSNGIGTFVLANDVSYLNIYSPGYYTICPSSVNYINVTLNNPFNAGPVLSIYSLRDLMNISQINPTVPLPITDTYIGGTNISFVSNINLGGSLTVGGLAPEHPLDACP
jgi:hypothetical protein